jgi:hypothetical protein
MVGPNPLDLLSAFVTAHAVPHPGTGTREPILFIQYLGGSNLQHHALPADTEVDVDEAVLEELHGQGLVSIDYREASWSIVPAVQGRSVADEYERAQCEELVADAAPFLDAVAAQAQAENKLAWPAVRPVLAAMRAYWEAGGMSPHGIQLRPLLGVLPDDQGQLAVAAVLALVEGIT